MTASLKSFSSATAISRSSRSSSVGVCFQLTMNPLMPALLAYWTCCSIVRRSSLE